jgi:hypothetical protein
MTVPVPFAYPETAHARRHAPAGYLDYRDYKPWLRDEFTFRCVYCLEREQWYPNRSWAFSVDHVVPRIGDPARVCDYENLVYACLRCNSNKRDIRLPDPTRVRLSRYLSIGNDGMIDALNPIGQDMIDLLHLNDSPAIDTRRRYLRILRLKQDHPRDTEVHHLYLASFGYPDDLPNLALMRPPGGNRRRPALAATHYRLRRLGKLGEVY